MLILSALSGGGAMDLTKARLGWVELYAKTGVAGLVCRRCGISRPTLRKWWPVSGSGDVTLTLAQRKQGKSCGMKQPVSYKRHRSLPKLSARRSGCISDFRWAYAWSKRCCSSAGSYERSADGERNSGQILPAGFVANDQPQMTSGILMRWSAESPAKSTGCGAPSIRTGMSSMKSSRAAAIQSREASADRLLKAQGGAPRRMITDILQSYGAARRHIMPNVEHWSHKGLNNRAENSHLPLRKRERVMQTFRCPGGLPRFVSIFSSSKSLRATPLKALFITDPRSPPTSHGRMERRDRSTCLKSAKRHHCSVVELK